MQHLLRYCIKMKTKFSDYDAVKAICFLDDNVSKGTRGAVLMVFESEHSRYEVEFVDFNGDTLAVLTVDEINLELVQRAEE